MSRLVTRNDRYPLEDRSRAGIVTAISGLLDRDKSISKITLDLEKASLKVVRLLPSDGVPSPFSYVENMKHLEEYELDLEASPYEELFRLFEKIREEECFVTHLLVNGPALLAWLRAPKRTTSVFGKPIYQVPELPKDVVLVCGSEDEDGSVEDVAYAVKVTLP